MPMRTLSKLSISRLLATSMAALCASACIGTPISSALARPQDSSVVELPDSPEPDQAPTYVDLVEMALAADTVAIVEVAEQIEFPPERTPGLPLDRVRLYIESLTQTLLASPTSVGEEMIFVVDQQRDFDGDSPDLEEQRFLIFGDRSTAQQGGVQLLSSRSMLPAGPRIEARTRRVLTQLAAGDMPPAIAGLRDVISVPGNLAGESETQIFVETETGAPVSLTVIRRPGMEPVWGVSLGEIVDASARPPAPESLAWYRFACFLPRELPAESFLQNDYASQDRARQDYAFIIRDLGACERRFM